MAGDNNKHPYLDGDAYYDIPDQEYSCSKVPKEKEIESEISARLYPCYVYDRHGNLLRVEHPKGLSSKNLKWAWKFGREEKQIK